MEIRFLLLAIFWAAVLVRKALGFCSELSVAAKEGDYKKFCRLFEECDDPNAVDNYGQTPLMHIKSDDYRIFQEFIFKVDLNKTDSDGRNYLHHAARVKL